MRDLFFIAFLLVILIIGTKRPFLFILTYCYVDIVAPQRLSFTILPKLQLSLLCFVLAVLTWVIADRKRGLRIDKLQVIIGFILLYCGVSTIFADVPVEALEKWNWVWKALLWSMFLPLTLTTRLRIEALGLTMVLSIATLVLDGALKTAAGGSGYGSLQIFIPDNSGLFEGSTISTVAIATIPLILWLARHGTVFKQSLWVWLFAIGLVGACVLIPIGTQTRTGLLCAVLLVGLGLRDSNRRLLYIGGIAAMGLVALPLVPSAYSNRLNTIGNYQSDESASTRVAVWQWTWNHVLDHPLGGGFEMYRLNELQVNRVETVEEGGTTTQRIIPYTDRGRAFHNSYIEMLGEQGFPGLAMWLTIHITCLIRMERLRRRYRRTEPQFEWVRGLATALQGGQLVYLLGSMFVGIAFQPYVFMLIAMEIGIWTYLRRREQETNWRPIIAPAASLMAMRSAGVAKSGS